MPAVVTFGPVNLLTAAPTATDSASTFPSIAHNFFGWVWTIVGEINYNTAAFATPLTATPHPPSDLASDFASAADTNLASFPQLVIDVNGMIDELSLPVSHVSTLPASPSRGGDPTNFTTKSSAFLAALPTFRTEMNAYINALNAYSLGLLSLSGDMQSGTDAILLSGDMQTGTDNLRLSGSY